jgi:carboxymethylenebutenolidase
MRWKTVLALAGIALWLSGGSAGAVDGQKLTVKASERPVQVTLFRAAGDGKRPAALLLHGAGGFDSQIASYNEYASRLAENGIDAYLVYYYSAADDYGMHHGDDVFEQRYGAWAKLVDDLADGLLKSKDSNGKVGLVGFSNGALLATGASARDAKIAAAVIYYGGMPWAGIGPVTRFPPLLILHGDADTVIPVMEGQFLADTAKQFGGPAELVIYPGEKHGFGSRLTTPNGADGLKRTVAFLRKELGVP